MAPEAPWQVRLPDMPWPLDSRSWGTHRATRFASPTAPEAPWQGEAPGGEVLRGNASRTKRSPNLGGLGGRHGDYGRSFFSPQAMSPL